MAMFRKSISLFLVASVVLQVINPSSGVDRFKATTDGLSSDICSDSVDPPFCLQVMNSIPGATKAQTLESLGHTAITFSHSKAVETLNYIRSLVESAKNPRLKVNYDSCASNYDGAIRDLEDAENKLKSKDYFGMLNQASSCMTGATVCEDNFKQPPMTDPSHLPEKNKYFHMLCRIILMVASDLRKTG